MVRFGAMYMGGPFSPKVFGKAVEAAGFDSLWAGDHVLHYVDGIATLGCFAGCTDRITLGASVLVAPFRSPATLAKGLITAAFIAEGRELIAGIGPGGDVPKEFDVTGADIKTRGAYTNEALEVMKLLWSGETVSFEGRFSKFSEVRMLLAPTPDGGVGRITPPRIWVGGRSEASLRRAVRHGTGYLPYLVSPSQLRERVARLKEICEEEGRPFSDLTIGATSFVVPADSKDAALDLALAKVGFKFMTRENMGQFYILGEPRRCADKIAEYVEAGATHVVLGCHPGQERQLECFLEAMGEILPMARRDAHHLDAA